MKQFKIEIIVVCIIMLAAMSLPMYFKLVLEPAQDHAEMMRRQEAYDTHAYPYAVLPASRGGTIQQKPKFDDGFVSPPAAVTTNQMLMTTASTSLPQEIIRFTGTAILPAKMSGKLLYEGTSVTMVATPIESYSQWRQQNPDILFMQPVYIMLKREGGGTVNLGLFNVRAKPWDRDDINTTYTITIEQHDNWRTGDKR